MKKMLVAAVAATALVLVLAAWLIRANTLTAGQLCVALARMIASSQPAPGTADYHYYRTHPAKLAQARKQILDQLPCRPPAGVTSRP